MKYTILTKDDIGEASTLEHWKDGPNLTHVLSLAKF